jgi:Transcriptional regulators
MQGLYRTKRDIAAELLREEIVTGRLAPGTRLVLEELSQRYQLSMTPIREAFSLLESEGLIVQLAHKGAHVSALDREEVQELYAIRGAMEQLAAREGVPRLSDADLAELGQLLQQLESFDDPWGEFRATDLRFHRVIYRAAGSHRWMDTIENLWQRCQRYMVATSALEGAFPVLKEDHRAIYRACVARDAAAAADLIGAHLKKSEERLLQQLLKHADGQGGGA